MRSVERSMQGVSRDEIASFVEVAQSHEPSIDQGRGTQSLVRDYLRRAAWRRTTKRHHSLRTAVAFQQARVVDWKIQDLGASTPRPFCGLLALMTTTPAFASSLEFPAGVPRSQRPRYHRLGTARICPGHVQKRPASSRGEVPQNR
jgi:hypothetical protein